MRHTWIMPLLAVVVLGQTPSPETILARRIEQQMQFSHRMGRETVSRNQLQILNWLKAKGKTNDHR